jgi:pimeloyl-ACP methyl ester carboxylesterase
VISGAASGVEDMLGLVVASALARLPDASHWVHHDEAERVNQLLIDFFTPALPTEHR